MRHNALITNVAQWERHGDELHGDWFLPDRGGFNNVHASVQLRSYNQLIMRGSLVVILDLFALFVLWLLLVLADGAFGRWLRMQRRRWLRSYRARLTLALFAFFVIPAGVFAAWSYQRLRSDDGQARDLLVRETLRGVAVYTDSAKLSDIAAKFETPLFLYADGILLASSDTVLDALAPVGRLLPPSIALTLEEGDQITSSSDETVGGSRMLFGFRVAEQRRLASGLVLAAPGANRRPRARSTASRPGDPRAFCRRDRCARRALAFRARGAPVLPADPHAAGRRARAGRWGTRAAAVE